MMKRWWMLAVGLVLHGLQAVAEPPSGDSALQGLTAQQREEYQQQWQRAATVEERQEIQSRYRDLARTQSQSGGVNAPCGNRGTGGQPGAGMPCTEGKYGQGQRGDGKGIPAGDKNRPKGKGR
ncbi:hypothetical protein FV139_01370 [Parahaliea maris]|uniref:Uncharacterized protein n=1 Tax=Parahaliea maris TaxID=2716870 RepID=A0A5C9A820_9GAMM|nr:hypothetical protein [Parahaliea maris]TXS96184.1 hypothetical protein FV139_01370 [Parahaliea maris]